MCRYHIAIPINSKTTSIKFKVNEKVVAQIDWKIIGYHNLNNYIFENSLSKSIAGRSTYYN